MTDLIYPSGIRVIVLFGGSDILPRLVVNLQLKGYAVHVYTSPRQAAENIRGETLISALKRVCLSEPIVAEDINATFDMDLAMGTIGLGIGEAWCFGKAIREAFGNRLLGFMSIPLPRYRGGAHISWAIMRGERDWGGSLQMITANTVPGECDDGDIVSQWYYDIPAYCRIPQQWFDYCGERDIQGICDFLTMVAKGRAFHPIPVEGDGSLFLPRLRTADNSWIDWSQPADQLERQICAYDDPYAGAKTYLYDPHFGDREVALKGVSWDGLRQTVVPFQRGLVLRIQDGIRIAAMGGEITVKSVLQNGADFTSLVRVGMRFHVPIANLEKAMHSIPLYTPKTEQ